MKKDWLKKIVVVALAVAAAIGSGYYGHQQGYEEGHEKGYDDGYSYGYSLAHSAGVEMANAKYHQGYDDGYKDAGGVSKPNLTLEEWKEMYYPTGTTDDSQEDITVYITDTGSKYHRSWCGYLHSSSNAVYLSWATSNGYSACSRCW